MSEIVHHFSLKREEQRQALPPACSGALVSEDENK